MSKQQKKTNKFKGIRNFYSKQLVDLEDADQAIMQVAQFAIEILHENAFVEKVADKIK